METCRFCGALAPATTMDMTGHGWRCTTCTARAAFETFNRGGDNDMGQHLNRRELEKVSRDGGNELFLGVVLAVLSGLFIGVVLAAGSVRGLSVTGIVFVGALAMASHGAHRRGKARRALKG
jgi:hypothetical protein